MPQIRQKGKAIGLGAPVGCLVAAPVAHEFQHSVLTVVRPIVLVREIGLVLGRVLGFDSLKELLFE